MGTLYAHSHAEYFNVIKSSTGYPLIASIINPSVTTLPMVNPTFRIYEMDSQTYELLDFVDYRMDVNKSNKERKAYWYEALRFTEYFNVSSISAYNIDQIIKNSNVALLFIK